MKAIIIAAGSGKRISKDVSDQPKAMVKVNGKPIVEYQISTLRKAGISDISLITGPYSEKFQVEGVSYIKDEKFSEHEILGSLMEAKNLISNEVLILYSDIIFELKILKQILDSVNDISIAIDLEWKKLYKNRTEHPLSEAENVLLNEFNKINKIKKNINSVEGKVGEFLGIIKLTKLGSEKFVKKYEELVKTKKNRFHEAPSISKAYLTDFLQELIESDFDIEPIFISGKWCEIDTMQDLRNAEKIFN